MTKIQVRKQFTTLARRKGHIVVLFSIWRRYKFESNSQQSLPVAATAFCCFQYDEDTSSKAIHNIILSTLVSMSLFSIWRRYKFESNSQHVMCLYPIMMRCFQYDEDTSSKAIHNLSEYTPQFPAVVFNMTKIQVRKQFTTKCLIDKFLPCCFQYDEDTSSKAIHNARLVVVHSHSVVFNMTKIQVRKQFTTGLQRVAESQQLFSIWRRYKFESNSQLQNAPDLRFYGCFQYDEDTSSKAIHNFLSFNAICIKVVFNMTKIQVRKQFTTYCRLCLLRFLLFSIWRRYKFESNSQLVNISEAKMVSCFQYDEDTSSKAIHNTLQKSLYPDIVVFNMTKIQVRKQFTTL